MTTGLCFGIILSILTLGLIISIFKDIKGKTHIEYYVLGYYVDSEGHLIYTVQVRDCKTKDLTFFGSVPATKYWIHPLNDHKWHIVPEYDRHLYRK